MFNLLFNLSKLLIYSFYIKNKLKYINKISNKDLTIINKYINNCGCITIKCIQWLVPLLENEDINKDILNILNNVYENNYIHDIKYTEYLYKKHFNKNIQENFIIINVLGSGSIGQVYKIKDIKTNKFYVMKVKHPNIKSQVNIFKNIFKIIYKINYFNKLFYNYFPFDLVEFLEDFYKQADFINESNNILYFNKHYYDNKYIIIPKLIKLSSDMSPLIKE